MADISEAELRPYSKVLSAEEYRELTRAVGFTASHGVGIGSFVYLRRIFERLIEDSRTEASQAFQDGMKAHSSRHAWMTRLNY